jgi:hypothetical protein
MKQRMLCFAGKRRAYHKGAIRRGCDTSPLSKTRTAVRNRYYAFAGGSAGRAGIAHSAPSA